MKAFFKKRSASFSQGSPSVPPTAPLPVAVAVVNQSTSLSSAGAAPASVPITIPLRSPRSGTSQPSEPEPPTYAISSPVNIPPIPTYDNAIESGSVLRSGAYLSPREGVRDYFGTSPRARNEGDEGSDDDDPLIPRPAIQPPPVNFVPIRRNTLGTLPPMRIQPPAVSTPLLSTSEIPESTVQQPLPVLLPIETPLPPASALPPYSPNLARNELRLISTVHVADNHPAAAFFNAVSTNTINERMEAQRAAIRNGASSGSGPAPGQVNVSGGVVPGLDQTWGISTGGKRLKVTLKDGAERINPNGTGPVILRVNRGGMIEGTVEIGKGEGGIGLDIAILGMVNTSYYARGQYTLLDTLPIVREKVVLFPPESPETPEASSSATAPAPAPSGETTAAGTTTTVPSSSNTNPDTPAIAIPAEATGAPLRPTISATPRPMTTGKDPRPLLQMGDVFSFSLKMPGAHYRDETIDLPPSCAILQVGMQASVEYVLRVKLSRSRWRMNESVTIPIIYEPRAYISPRRLRVLTFNDAMNPGWRTIPLKGGKPLKESTPAPTQPLNGVECSLLIPTPPILFVAHGTIPPPIPFHLHFHSSFPLPLATFSNPRQCNFIIRLMRVATMKIGQDREIRRVEISSKVEVWGEDGVKIVIGDLLGEDHEGRSITQGFNLLNAAAVSAVASTTPGGGRRGSTSERRASNGESGSTRPTFGLRRRSVDVQPPSVVSPPAPTVAPIIEEPERSPVIHPNPATQSPSSGEATLQPDSEPDFLPGTSLSQTDVHLQGSLQIVNPTGGPELARRLIQSFNTPEVSVAYVLEVGIQPRKGAVKEAFGHVWGGGIIELVLGQRE